MRIGIDARAILNPEKSAPTGVANYVWQLVKNLLEIDQENRYVLFFDFKVRDKDVKRFSHPNVKIKFFPFSDYKKYMPAAYSEILGMATFAREKMDVLHTTSPLSRVPTSYRGKIVTTFYDFAPYRVPELFPRLSTAKLKTLYSFASKKSDQIIAVSRSTKEDARKFLGFAEEKITTIYNGIDSRFFGDEEFSRDDLKKGYGILDKYILFLGTLEPRKNLSRVIDAFAGFKEVYKGGSEYQLVVAGKKGWLTEEYFQQAKDLGIEEDVIFTGYVGGDELKPLYANAEFFVMPSLYEGFGQTIVEAMACGAPCLLSKVSSIPEIAGEAAYFVDPNDTEGIAKGMVELAGNKELREKLSAAGREQAKKFSWEKCARETLGVYKSFR
ncbi:MAG TPA: glycosyltransferase family 1 protein [Candidatus Bathyarchaeia archaeon]|nr:glycosyltransferase family 1 protein [Candidatus Bathyarchaeia archaeon]